MTMQNPMLLSFRAANESAAASPTAWETPCALEGECAGEKPTQSQVLRAYFARRRITVSGRGKAKKKFVSFIPIREAVLGYTVYVVVETSNLTKGDVVIQLKGCGNESFLRIDETAEFQVNGTPCSILTVPVGNYTSRKEYENAQTFRSYAIAELDLNADSRQLTNEWIAAISQTRERRAYVFLSVTSTGGNDTRYYSEDEQPDTINLEKGLYYHNSNSYFPIYACLCGKELEILDLESLGIATLQAEKFRQGLACIGDNYHIDTCLRIAHFISQLKHESGNFAHVREIWGPSAAQMNYEGNADLGNTMPGDGRKFMGRGLIQITGRANYTSYGQFAGSDFTSVANNERLERPEFAADSAGWFYSKHLDVDLNRFADQNDFIYISYRINGGFTGFRAREQLYGEIATNLGRCRSGTSLGNEVQFQLEQSTAYDKPDAIFKWANLIHDEGGDAAGYYQRYLDKTDPKSRNEKIKSRRRIAASRITNNSAKR